jgi:hypothetical protein
MILSIEGFTAKQTKELEAAARFFAAQLLHPKTVKNLQIDIERDRKLDVEGECISEDDRKNPRWFTINLRGARTDDDMIKTLAHEMVHVKQYAKNELGKELALASKGKGIKIATRWQGKFWNPSSKEDAYWDCPWEIEAYGREVGLYAKWVAHTSSL